MRVERAPPDGVRVAGRGAAAARQIGELAGLRQRRRGVLEQALKRIGLQRGQLFRRRQLGEPFLQCRCVGDLFGGP